MAEQPRSPPDPVRDATAIANDPHLDIDRKLALLRELELDARLRGVAADENMGEDAETALQAVQKLIAKVEKQAGRHA